MRTVSATIVRRVSAALLGMLLLIPGCTLDEPEVVIVNLIDEQTMVANPSFNGAVWHTVLRYGEYSAPQRCLRGSDQVHFLLFDPYAYCRAQAASGALDSLCPCDSTTPAPPDSTQSSARPLWLTFQTISVHEASAGDYYIIELRANNIMRDYTTPGAAGH